MRMEDVRLHVRSDTKRSLITCKVAVNFTRLFDLQLQDIVSDLLKALIKDKMKRKNRLIDDQFPQQMGLGLLQPLPFGLPVPPPPKRPTPWGPFCKSAYDSIFFDILSSYMERNGGISLELSHRK